MRKNKLPHLTVKDYEPVYRDISKMFIKEVTDEDINNLLKIVEKKSGKKYSKEEFIDEMDITWINEDTISVKTLPETWDNLCGREWYFDMKNEPFHLESMN